MAIVIGPSFIEELEAAGLLGLPFSWGADGVFDFSPSMTPSQIAAVQAVINAHDPNNLPYAKKLKAKEMASAAKAAKLTGFYSSALGTSNHYSTDNVFGDSDDPERDQEDLMACYLNALRNKDTGGYTIDYPAKGVGDLSYNMKTHTAAQMIQVGDEGLASQRAIRIKLRLRLLQIIAAGTLAEVQAIVW